jgi:dienelactone hydrolase
VRTLDARDAARDGRRLPIEVWYPATEVHAGQDLADASRDRYEIVPGFPPLAQDAVRGAAARPGRHPLVVFSHGSGGHRRQSTFLTTHLASHGWVVAAIDHVGNTYRDMMQLAVAVRAGAPPPDTAAVVRELATSRPADAAFMIERVLAELEPSIDSARIGMVGHSMGGWTTLLMARRDRRLGAVVLLAPAGGRCGTVASPFAEALDFAWGRNVPALYLVATRDTVSPLEGMYDLLARTPGPRRLLAIADADHWHFCDRVEQVHEMVRKLPPPGLETEIVERLPPAGELCPGSHAHRVVRGLTLAHFAASLEGARTAARLLDGAAPADQRA